MKEPGTAYDDPRFGKDRQVAHMKQFKTISENNGGVHIFGGVPNRAFLSGFQRIWRLLLGDGWQDLVGGHEVKQDASTLYV
ncbi:hypothetical protein FVEN_g12723 [Fusarium venenatum]|uniref:Uncharacterized protein n=1 Tax=Fusarium venenatum TaxID=56646 RepID=A0A2L2STR1_9HYPO|nr:uncharacterized protein FVRRES_13482 [Fusarium venenatum]KAG8358403.1 hypothetical protein FVEN_g12723 [Fusarium venenatum]CEI41232.1 unnamed protein product [Fusarium venenatum]